MKALILKSVRRFVKDESAISALEYALIAGLIALAIIGGIKLFATGTSTVFSSIAGVV